jgi:anti-sigma factor RsiW
MSQNDREWEVGPDRSSDRAFWQRCRVVDTPEDEAARFLDIAAFADGILDPDEYERVAALLADDPAAAADVAAARALARDVNEVEGELEPIVARACALLPGEPAAQSRVVPFAPYLQRRRIVHGLTQWGSLAAALAVASWLGFAMGSGASLALSQAPQSSEPSLWPELLDPGPGFLRDLGEGLRT